jgi:hypothetical protein
VIGAIAVAGLAAILVVRAIRGLVAVRVPIPKGVAVAACVAVVVRIVEVAVVTAVIFHPVRAGASGAGRVGVTDSMGVAVTARGTVTDLRGGGDEPPVLARAPAAGCALSGGPVRHQQAEQGKHQASHAIHLLVRGLSRDGTGG